MNVQLPASAATVLETGKAESEAGRIDRNGVLLDAGARLMRLHLELGGAKDGELAVPPLLDLAHHSLRLGMRLSRPVTAAGATALIDMWCECTPDSEGVSLLLSRWDERPLPEPSNRPALAHSGPADPHGARIHLDPLGRVMRFVPPAGYGKTDAAGSALLKPLSAILTDTEGEAADDLDKIDGQRVALRDDDRVWIASLRPDPASPGMVVTLSQAPALDDAETAAPPPLFDGERIGHLFGTQIGPALRQPIGRIIANAETIGGRLEGPLRADYAGYASDIASAGRHLLALVDDLSDLEAIEASGFSAAREPVDLADLARRAAGLLALKAADRKIRIDKPAEDEALPAVGEFRRVLQVLLNLLGNAINYAPDGSMIWLRLDDGPDWVSVTIADQGPGLSSEDQQRLFNKWERLGRSGDGGSGLGLYISRRLALAMEGDLTVESAPGQGARFTLVLPRG
ncbi:sensor histidine kinase KdpD [Blastomonas sp.]|uniref:sensor histidine kinase n=1 Tax=Blastomonas sp. TaxID=1909299 RepID=UPI00261514C3|nr:HAMP domain-containing sensor histidine kinase [Blastomonas sp.]MDM7954835.1 HAMP domain-containing sensor histidine kinase [Blastomonas sp.]